MTRQRWTDDERGSGVADAHQFAWGIEQLLEVARTADWVAEEPDKHLLPHLARLAGEMPFDIIDARAADDGSFDVSLRWTGAKVGQGVLRAEVFRLIGAVAETASYVRQKPASSDDAEAITFEVVTGLMEGDGSFKSHGHTLRLRISS
jgi:hypothetical protein